MLPKDIKFVNSFHLTLKFLSQVPNCEVFVEKLSKLTFNPFELELYKIGAFPNKNFIKIIWVGLKEESKLFELQNKIEDLLRDFNIKNDFKFHPHITLARVYKKIKLPDIEIKPIKFHVKNIVLYKSEITSLGPVYNVIKKF